MCLYVYMHRLNRLCIYSMFVYMYTLYTYIFVYMYIYKMKLCVLKQYISLPSAKNGNIFILHVALEK